jgi:DNA modification methylase
MKSTMAKELVQTYSEQGEAVLDPFSGSGTVPLEGSITGRHSYGIDRNPYSVVLSEAKLNPPINQNTAVEKAKFYLDQIDPSTDSLDDEAPEWVQEFFHPKTLSGIQQLFPLLRENDEYFLLACLLGILHHQRPGFLSHPASNLRPYLRDEKFPRDEFPERYEYREIEPRLISKIERAYRRFPEFDRSLSREIWAGDTSEVMEDELDDDSIDAIITSPPYMNKLDYGRDNRLRLYFIGVRDYRELDGSPTTKSDYEDFLSQFLHQASRVLKPDGRMIFVMGESRRSGSAVDTSEVLSDMIQDNPYGFLVDAAYQDKVPVREINSMSSKTETILVIRNPA